MSVQRSFRSILSCRWRRASPFLEFPPEDFIPMRRLPVSPERAGLMHVAWCSAHRLTYMVSTAGQSRGICTAYHFRELHLGRHLDDLAGAALNHARTGCFGRKNKSKTKPPK